MDGGAWWAAVHGVAKGWTRLRDWETSLSLFTFLHWRRKWQPTPVFLPGESQGRGSLVAAVYGVAQSQTRLKWLSSSSSCDYKAWFIARPRVIPTLAEIFEISEYRAVSGTYPRKPDIHHLLITPKNSNLGKTTTINMCQCKEVSNLISNFSSVQFSSVAQSCPTLYNAMNCSTPGLPVHYQLPEFTRTHVHRVSDAIQPSHPLSSPSPPAPNPSQHHSLFQWVNSSHEVAKVLVFQLQHHSLQRNPRADLLLI